jgi:very-short-patch-repair endonuclease
LCHLAGMVSRLGAPAGRESTVERTIARIASRAHGVVTRQQLLTAGVSDDEIRWRLRMGSLHRQHRGVYRVGHVAPSLQARYLAAVLACGADALLSGRAAGHLLGLVKGSAPGPEVTAPTRRRVPGVRTRRSRRIEVIERMRWSGIPVTTPAQTLVDLAAVLDEEDLARACHEAGVRHRTTPRQVAAILARHPSAAGARKLRGVMEGEVQVTLSGLERRFLELLREGALPLPRTNKVAGARRVDCIWEDPRLIIELDSYRYHHSRHAWEQDRRREREARARRYEFRRYTHDDVFRDPTLMLRGARGAPRRKRADLTPNDGAHEALMPQPGATGRV